MCAYNYCLIILNLFLKKKIHLKTTTKQLSNLGLTTVMPRKIKFTVVSSSSHEDNCDASELMVHAPTVSGWRSTR